MLRRFAKKQRLASAGNACRYLRSACAAPAGGRGDQVERDRDQASFNSGLPGVPLFEARVYAITFAAVHDALNRIDRRYSTYASTSQIVPGASPEAAVATAAHAVLVDQFNQLTAYGFAPENSFLDAAYTASLALIPDGLAKSMGVSVGTAAAAAVSALACRRRLEHTIRFR